MRNVISLLALCMLPTPATAQSMNVRAIVETVMGDVCAPYARDGDIASAVRAAEASGLWWFRKGRPCFWTATRPRELRNCTDGIMAR